MASESVPDGPVLPAPAKDDGCRWLVSSPSCLPAEDETGGRDGVGTSSDGHMNKYRISASHLSDM